MTFIVEDGTGVAGANAGVSLEFANDYHASRGNDTWALFTDTVKQQLIVKATDYVRDVYGLSLAGVQKTGLQGWLFPRTGVTINGYLLPSTSVPMAIREAICELALVAKSTPLLVNVSRGKKMVKVGPLQVEYDGTSAVQTKFVTASLRLAPFLIGSGGAGSPMVPLRRV